MKHNIRCIRCKKYVKSVDSFEMGEYRHPMHRTGFGCRLSKEEKARIKAKALAEEIERLHTEALPILEELRREREAQKRQNELKLRLEQKRFTELRGRVLARPKKMLVRGEERVIPVAGHNLRTALEAFSTRS